MKGSPPAIDHLCVSILEPPEAPSKGALHLPLDGVDLVAGHPLLPLELWVAEDPPLLRRPGCPLPLVELDLPGAVSTVATAGLGGGGMGHAVTPEIVDAGREMWRPAAVGLELHPSVVEGLRSEAVHGSQDKPFPPLSPSLSRAIPFSIFSSKPSWT